MVFDTSISGNGDSAIALLQKYIGQHEVVEVKKVNCNRTISQNNYLHLILSFFSDETGYSLDDVKVNFFKRTCNADIFVRARQNKRGQEVTFLRSTSDLSKEEMSLAISRFRNWSASPPVSIYIPSPEDKDFVKYCKVNLNNREFDNI